MIFVTRNNGQFYKLNMHSVCLKRIDIKHCYHPLTTAHMTLMNLKTEGSTPILFSQKGGEGYNVYKFEYDMKRCVPPLTTSQMSIKKEGSTPIYILKEKGRRA